MLATEKTKTVTTWKDVSGTEWDSKEAAEHSSVSKLLNNTIHPSHLVALLKQRPEAKAWLLPQLGEQPAQPFLPTTYNYQFLASKVLDKSSYPGTIRSEPHLLAEALKEALAPYTVPEAQPQQGELLTEEQWESLIKNKDECVISYKHLSWYVAEGLALADAIANAGYKLVKA